MVGQAYSPGTWQAEARGLLVQGQPVLHRETLSQNKQRQKQTNKQANKYKKRSLMKNKE
jgi:hypothetical protein